MHPPASREVYLALDQVLDRAVPLSIADEHEFEPVRATDN